MPTCGEKETLQQVVAVPLTRLGKEAGLVFLSLPGSTIMLGMGDKDISPLKSNSCWKNFLQSPVCEMIGCSHKADEQDS